MIRYADWVVRIAAVFALSAAVVFGLAWWSVP